MLKRLKEFLFKNTSAKQTVAKNSFWLTVSNFGGRLIKAVIVIYGARVLGTAQWGVFSYAITLAGFFTLFIDPGVNAMIMRESPKADEDGKRKIMATTMVIKAFLIIAAVFVVLFVAPYFSTLPGAKELLPIVALIICFDTLREFFSSFIRGREKMEWEAGVFLLTNIAIVIAGIIFLSVSKTPMSFGWAYTAGTAIGAILAATVLRKNLKGIFSYFSGEMVKPILSAAWPFAVTGALGALLTNADIIIISWMRTASEVGVYSAAIRIVQTLYLVPMVLQFSTLPVMARLAHKDNDAFRDAMERTISLVFLASIPLAIGGAILSTQVITLIFGPAYLSGVPAFQLLMLTLLFDYPAAIISTAIFAYNHQKSLIITSAIAGISNVALDLLLIPYFGIVGSAAATLVANILSNWYLWRMMNKINPFSVRKRLGNIFTAGIAMGVVTALLYFAGVNVIINIAISVVVYFSVLYVRREPLLIEIKRLLFPVRVAGTA